MTTNRIISILIAIMGLIHIGATFSPLIGGKLANLDSGTYNAMIYMSLMCGLLLVLSGSYLWWAVGKVTEHPMLRPTIVIAASALLINGILAVAFMPHNIFAWTIGMLCLATFTLNIKYIKNKQPLC